MAAELTLELGRIWESMAWSRYGLSLDPSFRAARETMQKARSLFDWDAPKTRAGIQLVDANWLQSFGLPAWNRALSMGRPAANEITLSRGTDVPPFGDQKSRLARFEEIPGALDFTYFASRNPPIQGRRMFEITGGGVGVLDYDRDGWSDLFLAQGTSWPSDGSDATHVDRLLRNRGKFDLNQDVFQDVTRAAGIVEAAFGQGVAVGDVNSDGFDDIYVANIGQNQLWMNQGDGTWNDGTSMIESSSDAWTVSAAIADLNGDGMAEIYDANYVEGVDVYTRLCNLGGLPRACSPLTFRPAKGRLLAVNQEGIFQEVGSRAVGSSIQDGNAMGLLVFRLKENSLPSIFVANDQIANVMLTSQKDEQSPLGIRFEDHALLTGLAFNGAGKAQACMGIAADDVDGDGGIDILVTNFYDEGNTLYVQQDSGLFHDATGPAGLIRSSLKMLGFGAQFFDADLNGTSDLVVLNGHIDDRTHMGIPHRMRPQFYSGDGRGGFIERNGNDVGLFFQENRLGRSLALLDFDRDGRQDFVATDLEGPSKLVRNVSEAGSFLSLALVGTQSHRDAIGAEAVVVVGDRRWTRQLMAGSGYMASNQKSLHFGLGSAARVDRIEIAWPSGLRQIHTDVPVNVHWQAIENQPKLFSIPR